MIVITWLCSGGKSAIMTGLVVALGGRASQTSRGLSVKNFVKKGCRWFTDNRSACQMIITVKLITWQPPLWNMECCRVFDLAQQLKWPFSTISHCSDLSSRDPLPQEQTRPELFVGSVTGFIENKSCRWNEKVSLPGSTYKDIFLITWWVLSHDA